MQLAPVGVEYLFLKKIAQAAIIFRGGLVHKDDELLRILHQLLPVEQLRQSPTRTWSAREDWRSTRHRNGRSAAPKCIVMYSGWPKRWKVSRRYGGCFVRYAGHQLVIQNNECGKRSDCGGADNHGNQIQMISIHNASSSKSRINVCLPSCSRYAEVHTQA